MQEPQGVPQRRQRRRRLTGVWIVVSALLVLVIIVAAGAAWAGLVPGLSHVTGADKPRDLGVRTAPADYDSAVQHLSAVLEKTPPAASGSTARTPGTAAPKQLQLDLTETELSALLGHSDGGDIPLQNPQVKIHAGGLIEISAAVVTTDIPLDQLPAGVIRQLVADLPDLMPVYVRGTIRMDGPTALAMDVERLELGRLPLPASVRDSMNHELVGGVLDQLLDPNSGVTVQELRFEEGMVHLKVTTAG